MSGSRPLLPSTPVSTPSETRETKSWHACVPCANRKVRCDKSLPSCETCTKSRAECVYRAPAPPNRKKRKAEDYESLLDRVKRYEELIENAGLSVPESLGKPDGAARSLEHRSNTKPSSTDSTIGAPPESSSSRPGAVLVQNGKQRYFEHDLLLTLSKEFQHDPAEAPEESADSESAENITANLNTDSDLWKDDLTSQLLLDVQLRSTAIAGSHPPKELIWKLWSTFLSHVNPLTHLIHAPSVEQQCVHPVMQKSAPVSKGTHALLHSIYASAVASMTDQECRSLLQDSQENMLRKYQCMAQHSLADASFLKSSDVMTLQAFVLLIISMPRTIDPYTIWTMIGTAIRLAVRHGLHRDGSSLAVSSFDAEIRRRLWWAIISLDARGTELVGIRTNVLPQQWDTKIPLNVNDRDLVVEATSLPEERAESTEMTYCLFSYNLVRFLQAAFKGTSGPAARDLAPHHFLSEEQISDFERMIGDKYLKLCDPVNGLDLLTLTTARSMMCRVRHIKLTKQTQIQGRTQEHDEEMIAFSLKIIDYDTLLHSSRSTQRFLWHTRQYFPWGGLVALLQILAGMPTPSRQTCEAWQKLEDLFENHPEFTERRRPFSRVIQALTMRAWSVHQHNMSSQGTTDVRIPSFIKTLQEQQLQTAANSNVQDGSQTSQDRTGAGNVTQYEYGNPFPGLENDQELFPGFNFDNSGFAGIDWSSIFEPPGTD